MKKIKKVTFILMFSLLIGIIFIFDKPVYAENRAVDTAMVFNIENRATGKYLNVNFGTNENGTNVTQYTNDGSIEQKFRIVYHSSVDAYRIYAMCSDGGSDKILDVLRTGGSANGTIQSGNNVDIWARGDDPCQLFEFNTILGTNNLYYSITLKSNPSLALTVCGSGNGSGAGTSSTSEGNVFISNYTGATNQQWKLNKIAATPAYPYKNYRGSSGTYYIASSCNGFIQHIQNGINNWKSNISLTQTSSNDSTSIDFYGVPCDYYANDPTAPDDWLGHADRWVLSTSINALTNNWAYSIINLNTSEFNGSGITSSQKAAVVAHEMGHGYGLAHYETSGTIMYPHLVGMTVSSPGYVDRYAIDLKY